MALPLFSAATNLPFWLLLILISTISPGVPVKYISAGSSLVAGSTAVLSSMVATMPGFIRRLNMTAFGVSRLGKRSSH